MDRYQEALERIIVNFCCTCDIFDCEKDKLKKIHYDCPFLEDIYILQELVDKETPKKPVIKKFKESEHYICPNCKNHKFGILDYGEYKNEFRKGSNLTLYCPNCGQRLDWSEEVCQQK